MLIGVPLKAFGEGNARLGLDAVRRFELAEMLAEGTVGSCRDVGRTVVVTSDPEVEAWASDHDVEPIPEIPAGGLNGAASAVALRASCSDSPWMVVHADLPLLTTRDVAACAAAVLASGAVIAPSYDGGSNVVGGRGAFQFSYGASSFHRHLAAKPFAQIIIRLGTLLDLDSPADLTAISKTPRGRQLRHFYPPADV